MGDGDASCPEMGGLCGICSPLCSLCFLCYIDCVHPASYGGTLCFPARTPSALVRI